jgi:hypothetical protein
MAYPHTVSGFVSEHLRYVRRGGVTRNGFRDRLTAMTSDREMDAFSWIILRAIHDRSARSSPRSD